MRKVLLGIDEKVQRFCPGVLRCNLELGDLGLKCCAIVMICARLSIKGEAACLAADARDRTWVRYGAPVLLFYWPASAAPLIESQGAPTRTQLDRL